MSLVGKVAFGCWTVFIDGEPAARKSDLTVHSALIGEGEPSVVITGLPAARQGDRFLCSDTSDRPHIGGQINLGTPRVLVGGKPAARAGDMTICLGEHADISGLDGSTGAARIDEQVGATACTLLWAKYQAEAEAIIAPAGDNHRQRNYIINGAYANLYLGHKDFAWAGLAAYASKQVGCAMDHCIMVMLGGPLLPQKAMAYTLYNQLGEGNRTLFLDIYPMHRFYQEHGWARMKECAGERNPPLPAAALDGFEALDRYKRTGDPAALEDHLRALAFHEQVNILQRDIYNDPCTRRILDLNEGNVDDVVGTSLPDVPDPLIRFGLGKPADVVMSSECKDPTPGASKTIPFKPGREGNLYDVDQRMDWILNQIAGMYMGHNGSRDHIDDLERLRRRGKRKGGVYP